MKHTPKVHQNCDRPHCPICEGGLVICTVCEAAEGELTRECPGVPMSEGQLAQRFAGKIDFHHGNWFKIETTTTDEKITIKETPL